LTIKLEIAIRYIKPFICFISECCQ